MADGGCDGGEGTCEGFPWSVFENNRRSFVAFILCVGKGKGTGFQTEFVGLEGFGEQPFRPFRLFPCKGSGSNIETVLGIDGGYELCAGLERAYYHYSYQP